MLRIYRTSIKLGKISAEEVTGRPTYSFLQDVSVSCLASSVTLKYARRMSAARI